MKNKYIDLIQQNFDFPQGEFRIEEDELLYQEIYLMDLIKKYGTPLKFTYLPSISNQIKKAKMWFNVAIAKSEYMGKYYYCYCTKSSHFSFVLEEALKNDIHIETSSAFDINIVESLEEKGKLSKERYIICNGFKKDEYIENIVGLYEKGFKNVVPVLDNITEIEKFDSLMADKKQSYPMQVGIRIASEEEPKFEFYTSRLGIGYKDIIPFYISKIKNNPKFKLKMLHFFINTGVKDSSYYWNELQKVLNVYVELKKVCPDLNALNIGGGFPVRTSLAFEFDYEYVAEEIINQVKIACNENGIAEPDIFTEFGTFTVGESGGVIFQILDQKKQNDREAWNMIDGSFMTTLPDSWAINKRFIMLPVNHWDKEYERVLLGGLTCDSDDYYNSEQHTNAIFLPKFAKEEPLFIGFFYCGAYQESIGGYGGLQHCLLPQPKHIIIEKDEEGEIRTSIFSKEQSYKSMLNILGY